MNSNLHTESKCLGIVYKEYKPRTHPFNTLNKEKQLKKPQTMVGNRNR